jgi:DNA-binding transcriptional LysR family regulator
MDKLTGMHVFVRVVERGSFSAVARELGSTQSAVSKQVAALEAILGVRLLSRTTRALALTEAGERYFEQARRLVGEIAEVESTLVSGEQQLTGWLRVAASVAFGRIKLMPMVTSFLAAHPGVRIDLRLNDGFIDLVEQGIDVAVRIGELADSSLLARRVGTTQRVVVASPGYLASLPPDRTEPTEPDHLAQHNCIVYTGLATRQHWTFMAPGTAAAPQGEGKTVQVQGNLQSSSSEVVREAVLANMGIAHSPTWLFEEELANGKVVRLLRNWTTASLPVHLVSPQQRKHSTKVRVFGEHVARQMLAQSNT